MHLHNTKRTALQKGNVLWLIMVGVALLTALAMTLSRTGSNVEKSGARERQALEAAHILRTGQAFGTAVQNLTLQGISIREISFENPVSNFDYTNANCIDDSCRLFHINGAGLTYTQPKAAWLDNTFAGRAHYGDWLFTGTACVPGIGAGADDNCASSDNHLELLAILPYVRESLCRQANRLSEISNAQAAPPQDDGSAWAGSDTGYTGAFENGQAIADSGQTLFYRTTGCFEGNGTPAADSYHIFHVLKAR